MIGADDVQVLLSKFEGWTLEAADVSPPPDQMNVIRLRAPNGRVSWVALAGAFGHTLLSAHELRAGHRLLTRIDHAKRLQAERERAERLAARRAQVGEEL
jgi:hypothetical protein